jgi:hypothetical protein
MHKKCVRTTSDPTSHKKIQRRTNPLNLATNTAQTHINILMGTWVPSLQHFPDLRYNLLALTHGAFVRQIPVQNASLHLIQSPHPFPPLSKNSIGVVDLSNSTCGGCETPWKLAT